MRRTTCVRLITAPLRAVAVMVVTVIAALALPLPAAQAFSREVCRSSTWTCSPRR